MARSRNTDKQGKPFADTVIQRVWDKGRKIDGYDAGTWRHDTCGSTIKRSDHGVTSSRHGWEIDHIKPASKGGGDEISNLQPL